MTIPGVKIHSFNYLFSGSLSGISYIVERSYSTSGLDIWPARADQSPRLDITTLEVQSGGGKSTLARLLHGFLTGDAAVSDFFTWNAPTRGRHDVAMIPQRTSTVLHWRVKDLLARDSVFARKIIPDFMEQNFASRRLSELSGGQTARIFLASAFDRIASSKADIFYLILDEAFEGVDAKMGNSLLHAITEQWDASKEYPVLRILLITHFDSDEFLKGLPSRRLGLNPQNRVDISAKGEVVSLQEVLIDELVS